MKTLEELRKEKGWTQVELGKQLGVTQQFVQALEKERSKPSIKTMTKIQLVFGLKDWEVIPMFYPECKPVGVTDEAAHDH